MAQQKHSKKRDAILQCVRSTKSHPTADWVYGQLRPEIPGLSLGTVYRNLAAFKREGVIASVGVVDGMERFDANTAPHAHFVCKHCSAVIDVDVPLPEELRRRFHVPDGGEAIGIRCEEDFIGALQLLPDEEPGTGWLGWYWLDPAYRGTGRAFTPMGRVLLYYRHRGVELRRLRCGDRELRRFFARLGFYPLEGDVMEKDIRVQLPPIPAEYRP